MTLTLKSAITATQTTIDVDGSDALNNGDLYAIEDEQVYIVTAVAGDTQPGQTAWQRLTVQRGQLGTTEVAHDAATAVTLVTTPLGAGTVEVNVLKTTTTLTDAQVKALPTTSVTVVAASGAGSAILPLFVHLHCAAAADYTNIDAGCVMELNNGAGFGTLDQALASSVSGLLAPGDPADPLNAFVSTTQRQRGATVTAGLANIYDSDIDNKPLILRVTNGAAGNFTGGDAANVLTVTTYYVVVPV